MLDVRADVGALGTAATSRPGRRAVPVGPSGERGGLGGMGRVRPARARPRRDDAVGRILVESLTSRGVEAALTIDRQERPADPGIVVEQRRAVDGGRPWIERAALALGPAAERSKAGAVLVSGTSCWQPGTHDAAAAALERPARRTSPSEPRRVRSSTAFGGRPVLRGDGRRNVVLMNERRRGR
jgi:hypothetical protein